MEFLTSLPKEQLILLAIGFFIVVYLCKKILPYLLIAATLILALTFYLSGPTATLELVSKTFEHLRSDETKELVSYSKDKVIESLK